MNESTIDTPRQYFIWDVTTFLGKIKQVIPNTNNTAGRLSVNKFG